MIKRIFSDMDGTLLDNTGAVSEENVSLIKSAGIPMTLVSACAPMEMMAAIEKLDLTGAQVGFNGGLIYRV
ncbi:HAD family hydrolase, partial [Enterococcus faecium]|uniref:HAD family hydrolase n=1 Tax=Enterococcus faecium TaxID=1352 RepID=UPI0039FBE00D